MLWFVGWMKKAKRKQRVIRIFQKLNPPLSECRPDCTGLSMLTTQSQSPLDRCSSVVPPGWWRIPGEDYERWECWSTGARLAAAEARQWARETENRWQHGSLCVRGRRGLVFLLFPVCVYPWGVSRGYGCHIVPDISRVVAQCGSSVVLSVNPNT